MQRLDWLVYSSDDEALRRSAQKRTRQASDDLLAFADRIRPHGLHLVIEDAVDIAFELEDRHLPPGTVDGRGLDALALAVDDPTSVLITAGGIFIGLPIGHDPRWKHLDTIGRSRGTLGSSALSGAYLGLSVGGPLAINYTPDGVTVVETPR
jgi:hypothetical protein